MPPAQQNTPGTTSQCVWVYQQCKSGSGKIQGILQYSGHTIKIKIISIDEPLPAIIDEPGPLLPEPVGADLVLDHMCHPDLSHALAEKCRQSGIPLIASGKKPPLEEALTPRTCCALTQKKGLGPYGRQFGQPEFAITVDDDRIATIDVLRGAPCGATWRAAERIIGLPVDQARTRIGLETQFVCVADPAAWDPISGKSPVHIAAELHKAALIRALKQTRDMAPIYK